MMMQSVRAMHKTTNMSFPKNNVTMKQTIILGNIITMDEKRPFAKAVLIKNGVFAYIGSAEEAKRLASKDAQVLDYGDNFIYPGFFESHCHGHLADDECEIQHLYSREAHLSQRSDQRFCT